jgi:hypothetical protein
MFIGHYAASFAAKRAAPRLSLALLFLAAQALDLLFGVFVLAGVEKLRIVPGFTEVNAYDLYHMPYSHSLVASLGWSVTIALSFVAVVSYGGGDQAGRTRAAVLVGAAVFSHFVLDVPMHTPDLPLLGAASPKIGLGLWNHRTLAVAFELAVVLGGLWLYASATRAKDRRGTWAFGAFAVALIALTVATPFLPPPPGVAAFAVQALVAYLALALAAWAIDRKRTSSHL